MKRIRRKRTAFSRSKPSKTPTPSVTSDLESLISRAKLSNTTFLDNQANPSHESEPHPNLAPYQATEGGQPGASVSKHGSEAKGKFLELCGTVCLVAIAAVLTRITGEVNPFLLIAAYVFLVMVPIAYYYLKKDARKRLKEPRTNEANEISKHSNRSDTKPSILQLPEDPLPAALKLGVMTVVYFWLCVIGAVILAVLGLWLTNGG